VTVFVGGSVGEVKATVECNTYTQCLSHNQKLYIISIGCLYLQYLSNIYLTSSINSV